MLDFSDLEHLAVRLLVGADGGPTALARQWAGRFDEIMVDEYQDTNQVQNAIFQALSRQGRNLFLVGDVKQSIYRFRLADPTIFLGKYRSFKPYTEAAEGEERRIILSKNFRSRPQVLEGANYLFRALLSEEFGGEILLELHECGDGLELVMHDPSQTGPGALVKALIAREAISGWPEICIARLCLGRWRADKGEIAPLL